LTGHLFQPGGDLHAGGAQLGLWQTDVPLIITTAHISPTWRSMRISASCPPARRVTAQTLTR
jgi:hypothetical protein